MKKVKFFPTLFPFVIVLLVFSSCRKGDYYDDFSDHGDFQDEFSDEPSGSDPTTFGDGETFLTSYRINGDNIDKIKDFKIPNRFKDLQNDYSKHLQMWEYFSRMIPIEHRTHITEFLVFEGGQSLAGFVEPINPNSLDKWRMGLAIEVAGDLENIDLQEEFAAVSIHEFGHVLTLNKQQVEVGGSENSCANFHTGEGCSRSNSYINELFEIGWSDIYEEFLDTKEDHIYTRFFPKYENRFVSDYAATNPGEDVAEVFTYFVTEANKRTGNSIAAQKINALYAHPELVDLRKRIRQNPAVVGLNPAKLRRHNCRHQKTHRVGFSYQP